MKYLRRTSKDITNNFVQELLLDRGVITENLYEQNIFFNPTKQNEEDPSLLDNIDKGCWLLKNAIDCNKKIYLPVDADVDGFTSAALFYNYVTEVLGYNKDNIIYHIPEGKEHGLSTIMNWFPEEGDGVIFMLDSSSNDYTEHEKLTKRGYDICVIDHHEAPRYSEWAIVINNQLSKDYPNKSLSGVGVTYKFFEYWEAQYGGNSIKNYMDLATLGMISDVMPMTTSENRYFCVYGLTNINNAFFKGLVEKQSYSLNNRPLTQIGVAFYITPLINALIRVGNQLEKERLFQAFIMPDVQVPSTKRGEKGLMETICTQSIRNCINAKAKQQRERDKAAELLNMQITENCLDDNKILILKADDLGVSNTLTGLCAMNIAAEHKKPVLLGRITPDGKELKGSIRNFDNSPLIDLKNFLHKSGLMTYVEGHSNAAGFGIPVKYIDNLVAYANNALKDMNFNEGYYETDFVVQGNCTYLIELIQQLDGGRDLWGQSCPEPIIVVENITIDPSTIQIMGGNSDTVKFSFNGVEYIKFKAKDLIEKFKQYNRKISITAAGRPSINYWMGRGIPQIQLQEIEIKESSEFDF